MSDDATRKSRDAKRKAQRLANEKKRNQLTRLIKAQSADARLRMIRTKDGVAIGFQAGTFGFDQAVVLPIGDEQIVGAVESQDELAGIVTKIGLLTLAKLVHFNLAEGIDNLGTALAKWAQIDLAGLKAESEREYTAEDITKADEARELLLAQQEQLERNQHDSELAQYERELGGES